MARLIPHRYQQYCIDRIVQNKSVGLFIDMGLGKTAITLSAINTLLYDTFEVKRVLIIAPKKVAETTWTREAEKWDDFHNLSFSLILGNAAERRKAMAADADIYVVNRENTAWLVEEWAYEWPYDMVVIDESSSFKNHRALRFKALKKQMTRINRMVELTGTPAPRDLMDLWSQVYLLDKGQRLGRTISAYRDIYFYPGKSNGHIIYSYLPKRGAEEAIKQQIADICISMKADDYLDLPELVYNDVSVRLDPRARMAYRKMEREMLIEVDEEVVTAGAAAALRGKLLQMCNGAVYAEDRTVVPIHECKIEALMETIEQLGGQHALICYNFQHDKARLLKALKGYNVQVYQGPDQERAWNAGEIELMLLHPASCGYGLNLQDGGHHIIWFGLNDSLELYQQTNKRLHRQGQQHPVIVHHLLVEHGVDMDVIRALKGKADVQDELLEALKARIREVKNDSEGIPTASIHAG